LPLLAATFVLATGCADDPLRNLGDVYPARDAYLGCLLEAHAAFVYDPSVSGLSVPARDGSRAVWRCS
jgi:hypothetical protein